jgi:hypothetical protein
MSAPLNIYRDKISNAVSDYILPLHLTENVANVNHPALWTSTHDRTASNTERLTFRGISTVQHTGWNAE